MAVELDERGKLGESALSFSSAATQFYESGTRDRALSKAYLEYSTLMDAFSLVEKARAKRKIENDYEGSLSLFGKANEILRATLHFGFVAPYVSACGTLEVALEFESANDDLFQAYRNAIALFEQSKIALSLRDENHKMMQKIDAMLKFSIGGALKLEGDVLGATLEAQMKYAQSGILRKEYLDLARSSGTKVDFVPFFPLDDFRRVSEGAFVLTCPDADNLWILNLGCHPANIRTLANIEINRRMESGGSYQFSLKDLPRGKIRINYFDAVTEREFDEGCIFLI
jgi:hypothetical protein